MYEKKEQNRLVTNTNIVEEAVSFLNSSEELQVHLQKGNLLAFEQELAVEMKAVLFEVSQKVLAAWTLKNEEFLREKYEAEGLKHTQLRPFCFQIQTGDWVELKGLYAQKVDAEQQESERHLLARHFSIIGKSSPSYLSKVGLSSVISSSYDIANELLMSQGLVQSETRVRTLTNHLATHCFESETSLAIKDGENLSNQRVVISIDGGRCNTRQNRAKRNDSGNLSFESVWCEPKLFVIEILDHEGKLSKEHLPIYGCRFSDENLWALLETYLVKLQIQSAKQIQILADGAPWIWNNISPLLERLGVKKENILLTLDYYHASNYVHKLTEAMPKKITAQQKATYLSQFKTWLWQGESAKIVKVCRKLFKRPNDEIKRWINYIDKHQNKSKYADYKANNWMCGSGIVESAVRRVINQRFKNTGTFWNKTNVEKLFFLRGIFLSKRWNILMNNLVLNQI
jgi:hypothetical protein